MGVVAWQARVLSYYLSLVEEYPPFSLALNELDETEPRPVTDLSTAIVVVESCRFGDRRSLRWHVGDLTAVVGAGEMDGGATKRVPFD